MLSHGAGKWVTHATMKQPTENSWPAVCSTPVTPSDLIEGYPGLSQVNQGGIYRFLYGSGGSGPTSLTYQVGDGKKAASIGDAIWWEVAYYADHSIVDERVEIDRPNIRGARVRYSLYQYRTTEGTPTGGPAWNNGMVCSSFLAYARYVDGQGAITPYTYSHEKLVNAANALYAGVRDSCESSLGFWGSIGTSIACLTTDVCGKAANQVANCGVARMRHQQRQLVERRPQRPEDRHRVHQPRPHRRLERARLGGAVRRDRLVRRHRPQRAVELWRQRIRVLVLTSVRAR